MKNKILSSLGEVRKSLEKCRSTLNGSFDKQRIDFLEIEINKFKLNENGYDLIFIEGSRNTKTGFYVWPIFPTFNPRDLNRIWATIYYFFPKVEREISYRTLGHLFEWNEEGGINVDCCFTLYEILAKTIILSEVSFVEQG